MTKTKTAGEKATASAETVLENGAAAMKTGLEKALKGYDAFVGYGKDRIQRLSGEAAWKDPVIQIACAEVACGIDEMKTILHRNFSVLEDYAKRGEMPPLKLRMEYKFHNAWVAERCTVPAIDAIIRRAAELKAVIFQHTWFKTNGNYAGESTPDELVTLAKRFPEVPIICGHTGGNWELGIRAIRGQPNLYADLAGSDPTAGYTEMAVRELGASRVIYGSDCGGRSFASQLAKVHGAKISDADKQKKAMAETRLVGSAAFACQRFPRSNWSRLQDQL